MLSIIIKILKFRWLQVRNYLFRRLDAITRIEIFLFVLFFVVYFFHSINVNLGRILIRQNFQAAFEFYRTITTLLLLSILAASYGMGKRSFNSRRNHFLLSLPIPFKAQVHTMILNSSLPAVTGCIVLMGVQLLFARAAQAHGDFFLLLSLHLLEVIFLSLVGLGIALLRIVDVKEKVILFASVLPILVLPIIIQLKLAPNRNIFPICIGILSILMASAFTYFVIYKILYLTLRQNPDIFAIRSQPRGKLRKFNLLWTFYLSLAPGKFQSFILKDMTFAFRRYKTFLANIAFLMLVATIGTALVAQNGQNVVQWIFFTSIINGYIMANKAFTFYSNEAESLALIKTMPIRVKEYWWGKFWSSFLPVLWMTVTSHLFALFFLPQLLYWLGSFCLAGVVNFTLIFIQNNFALYSYPYTRYSVLWYNLYIITAVLFFTVLLFPPLSIVFLLFGFLAISRVLNRIKQWEIA